MRHRPSPNHDARPPDTPIDTIVLHYTGMQTAAAALDRLCDPQAAVSSHFLIEEDGTVWQMVDEAMRAFHAGVSSWRGYTALNGRSIGIEIVNPGHDWGYRPFPPAQMRVVGDLCLALQSRHPIDPRRVVGHSDIAPDRKQDPGELFDWAGLAARGVGLWTEATAIPTRAITPVLADIGYDIGRPAVVAAFQRHWRPGCVDGVADAQTCARAEAVRGLYGAADWRQP